MPEWPPIARNSDPSTAHVAAARIEPVRGTRRAKVLDLLRMRPGAWVAGHLIAAPDVGGSEGLRRLRELRQLGWPIERQPSKTSATGWEYRLVPDEPEPYSTTSPPDPPASALSLFDA